MRFYLHNHYIQGEINVGFGELSHRLPHVTAHQSFDIWSLGCILYQLCNEDFRLLFSGDQSDNLSPEKHHKDYVTGKLSKQLYQNSLWALHEWSDDLKASKLARVQDPLARSLLSDMLHKTPRNRPTIDEILIHPFLTGTYHTLLPALYKYKNTVGTFIPYKM